MRTHAKATSAGSTEGNGGGHGARLACLLGLTALLVGLLGVGSAAAAASLPSAFQYSHSFATEGQVNGPGGGRNGITVEPGTGNVLVVSAGQVLVFAPDSAPGDAPLTSFQPPDFLLQRVAVDPTSGAIYVQGYTSFTRWTSDGAAVPTYTMDPSFAPEGGEYFSGGIAVDPTTGDLLVVEPSAGRVARLDPSGARLSSFPARAITEFAVPWEIAVGSDGKIYVTDEFGFSLQIAARRFTAAGEPLGVLPVIGRAEAVTPNPGTGGADVTAKRPDGALWIEGFDSSGERVSEVQIPELPQGSDSNGSVVDGESGRFYAYTGGFGVPNGVRVFESVASPGTEAPTASAITDTSARIEAEVDPGEASGGGGDAPDGSFAYFEYSSDGGKTWPDKTPIQTFTAADPVKVEADLTGLHPNEKYLVRTVVGNEVSGHVTNPTPFTTVAVAPITATGSATDVSETSAVINGTIDPVSLQATYHFEYGLTTAYGSRLPAGIDAVAGNGRAPRIFSRTLTGLQPGTTYHYRLVAQNSIGISEGEDRTFTTTTAGAIPARTYEQVTPVDKLGSTVEPSIGFQAAPDGSAISYVARSPAGAESSPQFGRFMSYRGASDWDSGIPTDPPLNTARNSVFTLTMGISDDYSHAFVVSNRDLIGGGVENGANLYRKDLRTGQYTLAASTDFQGAFNVFTTLKAQNKFLWGNSDYSEVIFLSPAPLLPGVGLNKLYRWSVAGGLQLESILPDGSIPDGGAGGYVSSDGRRTYFSIGGGSENGIFLREGGQTRAISVSHRAGDPATPQEGLFLAASKDGRYGFFFITSASAPLTDDAPELAGDIYRYDAVSDELQYIGSQAGPGAPTDIATIGISDDGATFYFAGPNGMEVWREGALRPVPGTGVVLGSGFVSPSGRYLGYFEEGTGGVFLYDAASEELSCASCLSDGSNPGGANLPVGERQVSNKLPSAVDDQGQLFFDTPARLVAGDVNGSRDVYVFEDGQARLISPGNAPFDARFGDISADGSDIFFTTNQKLVGRDDDLSTDIYDARVNGGLPAQSPPPPQECLRDDCKATPNAGPELPFGGSEALSGPGNVNAQARKRCAKGTHARKVGGKQRCVKQKQAKKKKSKQGTKQAKSNRRQAR